VLVEPKNALGKQYKKLFSMNNVSSFKIFSVLSSNLTLWSLTAWSVTKFQVKLHFTEKALEIISKQAMVKNTGARGLRALLESILTEAMFEVTSATTNIVKVLI